MPDMGSVASAMGGPPSVPSARSAASTKDSEREVSVATSAHSEGAAAAEAEAKRLSAAMKRDAGGGISAR